MYTQGKARTKFRDTCNRQEPVRRSFLTRPKGSARPGEIECRQPQTGVQRCERLFGVARQFEVYCAGYHGPRRTAILGLIQIPDAIDNLDNVMLPYLISTIDRPGSRPGHGRSAAPFLRILLGLICAGMRVGSLGRILGFTQRCRFGVSSSAGVEGLGTADRCSCKSNQQAESRGTAVEPLRLADGAEMKIR
jgi:hypothetical protein